MQLDFFVSGAQPLGRSSGEDRSGLMHRWSCCGCDRGQEAKKLDSIGQRGPRVTHQGGSAQLERTGIRGGPVDLESKVLCEVAAGHPCPSGSIGPSK